MRLPFHSPLVAVVVALAAGGLQAADTTGVSASPTVAVLALQPIGADSTEVRVLAETFSNELLRTGRVRVMERAQIQSILVEQGFQQSGMCDATECAVQVGRLLGVADVVLGSVGRIEGTYAMNLRLVSMVTGEVVGVTSIKAGSMAKLLDNGVSQAARELFPGEAIARPNGQATASSSAKSSVRASGVGRFLPDEYQNGLEFMAIHTGGNSGLGGGTRSRAWWNWERLGVSTGVGAWAGEGTTEFFGGGSIGIKRDLLEIDGVRFGAALEESIAYSLALRDRVFLTSLAGTMRWQFHPMVAASADIGIGLVEDDLMQRLEASLLFQGW